MYTQSSKLLNTLTCTLGPTQIIESTENRFLLILSDLIPLIIHRYIFLKLESLETKVISKFYFRTTEQILFVYSYSINYIF